MKSRLLAFLAALPLLLLVGCETGTGPASLSMPPSEAEVLAAEEAGLPIAVSGVHGIRNSANGIDVGVTWRNISDRPIKYVRLSVGFKNAVDDWVRGEISGKDFVVLEYTGPYAPRAVNWGINYHESVFYHPNATQVIVRGVKVIFMDGGETEVVDVIGLPGTWGTVRERNPYDR